MIQITVSRTSGTRTVSLSFLMIQITVSRTSGTRTVSRYDPKYHSLDYQIFLLAYLERAQHFGAIENTGPEFLDYDRISV